MGQLEGDLPEFLNHPLKGDREKAKKEREITRGFWREGTDMTAKGRWGKKAK